MSEDAPLDERTGGRLRVATYNIHKGVIRELFGLRRVASVHDLRSRLHEIDADLIFLQEVLETTSWAIVTEVETAEILATLITLRKTKIRNRLLILLISTIITI